MDISAVARLAGVSTATVSRVLNSSNKVREQTALRVRQAIEELQYVPNPSARSLRSGRSNLYGLVVSDIRNPFFPDLIEHFERLATQSGMDVTFVNTGYSEERLLAGVRRLLERNVDGLAVFTSEVSTSTLEKIAESGVRVVFLNQPSVTGQFRNISVDYLRAFSEAVEHLHALGHRRVGFVAGPRTLSSAVRRREAFLLAMKASELTFEEQWMFEGDHKITGGQLAAERIFLMPAPPTAVICSNDMTAVGLLQTANRLGYSVPRDLSLVGFDDLFLAEILHPPLTTLHLSRQEIAKRAFLALQNSAAEIAGPQTSVIVPRLIVRDSTCAISNSGV